MSAPNRLIHELSPYLLQHSANPVDWWPWCDEAFAEAARRDVPVLVSIGYSACHWCHVMEHESFSDEATAAAMNERMVCIKVDREERPDVDALHMEFLQRMGGHGGWPLNVFVTPGRIPFHGGTYFPPVRRGRMPSWMEVVDGICVAYRGHKEQISASRDRIKAALEERQEEGADSLPAAGEAREGMRSQILSLDSTWGGFPGAPKFPPHGFLQAALSVPDLSPEEEPPLRVTVDRIAQGGIRDHLGGGFARYSTDENWLVPHFEKMLYDNAQLLRVLAESFARWRDPRHARAARETADWMFRELGSPQGGLMSALDADSEGEEGLFYVWAWEELEEILGPDLAEFARTWQATPRGNFEGKNILWRIAPGSEPPDPREAVWFDKLREVRERRIRPGLDSKVLASWNGLAVSGLARAGIRLGDPSLVRRAEKVAGFCLTLFRGPAGLSGVWKDGRTRDGATLEDWAFLGEGFLELWQATGDGRWFDAAEACSQGLLERFRDRDSSVLRFSEGARADLLANVSPLHDGATPSGNGSAARLLARFWHLTGNDEYRSVAEGICKAAGAALARFPRSYSSLWEAARLLSADVLLAHLAGDPDHPGFARLEEALTAGAALPDLRVVGAVPPSMRGGFAGAHPTSGRPQAWICRGTECLPPVEDPRSLAAVLGPASAASEDPGTGDSGIR